MRVYDLKTEYRKDPIGIDALQPRFSWKIDTDQPDFMQSAYQIRAYKDKEQMDLLWDSGKIESDHSQHVLWKGPALESRQRVYWTVTVFGKDDSAESPLSFFEMGLLHEEDWKCNWIEPEDQVDPAAFKPAPYLRKTFQVKKQIRDARIYLTAHGLYEFWINGQPGSEDRFKPGFTSYYHRIQYQVYDITELLREGENVWAVALGDGWWRGLTGGVNINDFGFKLHFLGQIILTYTDGTEEIIGTDTSFKTATGAIRRADMKCGEVYDATLEPEGWKLPTFQDSSWSQVHLAEEEHCAKNLLIASRSVGVREKEIFEAREFIDAAGNRVLDFGQNIAGYVRMKLRGLKRGQQIMLVHGEDVKNGVFSIENHLLGLMPHEDLFQQIVYTAKGDPLEEYCPIFAVFGFQYVLIKGYDGEILPGDFTAAAVYSDLEETGEYICSNELVNRLVNNSRWSMKGNYLDVPTDCPTRERSPWTGDSQVFCKTASDFMNVYPFFEKWMLDFNCEQLESGKICNTIPSTNTLQNPRELERKMEEVKLLHGDGELTLEEESTIAMQLGNMQTGGPMDGAAGWSDAAVINPYTMYLCYGDKRILENQYETMKNLVSYMFTKAKQKNEFRLNAPEYHSYTDDELDADYIWDTEFHWGEWFETDVGAAGEIARMADKAIKPDPEVPTAFLSYTTGLLSEIAEILGKKEDAAYFREKSRKVQQIFDKYLIGVDGIIKPGRQAPHVRALAFCLCSEEKRDAVLSYLAELVREKQYHLNTGFLATPYILNVLADGGYEEEAFRLLEQESAPSWLYNVKQGATTILEQWTGWDEHAYSFNHYSYGAVCDFLFSRVAGIQPVWEQPGYKQFLLKPCVGGTLTHSKADYESPYGHICSEWKKTDDAVEYFFTIPANSKAQIFLHAEKPAAMDFMRVYPDTEYEKGLLTFQLGSGKYHFVIKEGK
ncbi:MAG: family 78 glycoside hydrolase catalytic domain [Blautia sp.]|nr:family 78 glycoside hydrolase catalytic domain [Blautia sp.]